ncbi:MAG: nitrile hydratase subunit alpha [Gammaproteobacteria bacterium TMED95]|nr:nitrile hydratase subunit alpha [Gammaproteobacteria bacterium]OUV19069.1 MAG: nitrile hydratase subunit alpha [Gammaproteobacteria bacterium TMED95]
MTDHNSPQGIRAEAIESLLIDKGLLSAEVVDAVITTYTERVGPMNGAKLVAKAWSDPAFKADLLADATKVVNGLGFEGGQVDKLIVKECGLMDHHVVVCTLCSCYPWAVLGLPPAWYKDPEYRSRIVREPRKVLAEMGLELSPEVRIHVWDSSAEVRYLVLPLRPDGSEALSEGELEQLVSRDSMIGVTKLPSL